MGDQTFEGRTAAEAAIKACDALGVTRAALKYEVVSESGEGIDRRVVIEVTEVDETAAARASRERDDERPPRRERSGRDRGRSRDRRGGRDRDRDRDRDGGRGGRGRRRRSERSDDRGRRGGRGRSRRRRADDDGDIENLLQLEILPPEPVEERPEIEGEVSERAQVGREVLTEIIELAGFDVKPRLVKDDDDEVHFDLNGEDAPRVIGNKGDALLALQFLINRIITRRASGEAHIVLDAADYRNRRRDALAQLAQQLATRAVDEDKVVRLSPMSAHDRRIFHITLQDDNSVTTRSEGDGLYRPLLIIPASDE